MLATDLAISAAIVLASRLPTTISVFCFVLFSIQIFGMFPYFALWVRTTSIKAHWIILAVLIFLSDIGSVLIGGLWTLGVWILVQLTVTFLFPGWLLGLQKYKNEIQGPWDPAKPVFKNNN